MIKIVFYCLWLLLLILATFFDISKNKIPNLLSILGFPTLSILYICLKENNLFKFLLSSITATIIMILLSLFTKGKLGMGDAKLTLITSGMLGLYYWFISLLIASLSGLFIALILIKKNKWTTKTPIPFAPFLSFGAILALWLKTEGLFVP